MGRYAIFECIQQKAETIMGVFFCKAQYFKHFFLNIILINTHTAAAQFHAVQYNIVCLCPYPSRIAVQILQIFFHHHRKGMMHCHKTVFLLTPFQQRKFRNPEEIELIVVDEPCLLANLQTQRTQYIVYNGIFIRRKQQQIPRSAVHGFHQALQLLRCHKFCKGRFIASVLLHSQICQTLYAISFCKFHERIDFLSGHACLPFCVNATDTAAPFQRRGKDAEAAVPHCLRHIHQFHAKTGVRLVTAKTLHGFFPCHPGNGKLYFQADGLFAYILQKTLVYVNHIIHIHKRQFHIKLCKFRLTIRPQIFVPEAFGNLEITVKPGTHQKLLKQLGRLGQAIETARMHTAGHQIVSGPFRRGFAQNRCLDFQKAFLCHKLADIGRNAAAQNEVPLQIRPAQIQIPVLQPQILSCFGIRFNGKGRCFCFGQNAYLRGPYFNPAGSQMFIDCPCSLFHLTHNSDYKLAPEFFRFCEMLCATVTFFKYNLYHSGAVP